MIPERRRRELYTQMLLWMRKHRVDSVPLDIIGLCKRIGVELVPLSDITDCTQLSAEEVFQIWGNRDGVVNACKGVYRISYNDYLSYTRRRFTLCEELAHIIYGHIEDADFNICRQSYAEEKYRQYEEEARLGAGLLLCPPRFYYAYEYFLTPENMARICNISLPCAQVRYETYKSGKAEITALPAYQFSSIPKSSADLWHFRRAMEPVRAAASSDKM